MTPEQETHLGGITDSLAKALDRKYRAGQKQHGGNLWEKRVLPMMLDEITDLPVYALTLRGQIEEAVALLTAALNILTTGNKEGRAVRDDDDPHDAAPEPEAGECPWCHGNQNSAEWCNVKDPTDNVYWCTREKGHDGDHVACVPYTHNHIVERWPQDPAAHARKEDRA